MLRWFYFCPGWGLLHILPEAASLPTGLPEFGFSGRAWAASSEPPGCWVCLCLGPSPGLPVCRHSTTLPPIFSLFLRTLFLYYSRVLQCLLTSSPISIAAVTLSPTWTQARVCPHVFIQSWKNASHSLSLQPDHPRTLQPPILPQPPYGNFYSEVLFTLWFSLAVRDFPPLSFLIPMWFLTLAAMPAFLNSVLILLSFLWLITPFQSFFFPQLSLTWGLCLSAPPAPSPILCEFGCHVSAVAPDLVCSLCPLRCRPIHPFLVTYLCLAVPWPPQAQESSHIPQAWPYSYSFHLIPLILTGSLATHLVQLETHTSLPFSSYVWLVTCLVSKLCPTLCNPRDCSPPGSSVHGILQARILEWKAIPFFRRSSQPRD